MPTAMKTHRASKPKLKDMRPNAHQRGYGSRWSNGPRKWSIKREPLCRECLKLGRIVPTRDMDHILPRSQGGSEELSNLQGLCHSCHSKKTRREANA